MRVVCDTNILISALVFPGGSPERILDLARQGHIELYISDFIINEFSHVLEHKFHFGQNDVHKRVDYMKGLANTVAPKEKLSVIRAHEPDNRILECAVAANADVLISGDKHVLRIDEYKGIKIVAASDFVAMFDGRVSK